MAKPSSAHTDSAAPARRTRSQSAEPVEPPRSGNKRSAPSASAPVKRARQKKAAPDLTTVEEDGDVEGQQEEDDRRMAPTEEPRRVSAAMSVISGTTAKTSFSQEEVDQMDADVIVDSLPRLAGAFDDLAQILIPAGKATPPETWKEIRRPGSKHNKLFQNRLKSIGAWKGDFGSQEYIQPRIVLKALFGAKDDSDVPNAPWRPRPDDIILRINLIQMMASLLVNIREPGERTSDHVNALERLLISYPDSIAGRQYSSSAMELYANIAAHVAIAKLEASVDTDPNFLPHYIIDAVFFDEDDAFVHAAGLGLNSTTNASRNQAAKIITDLVAALKAPFKDPKGRSAIAAIGALKLQFRWDDLRNHSLRYYEGRTSQLAERIEHNGGIDGILQSLSHEIEHRAVAKEAEVLKQKLLKKKSTKPGSTQRKTGSMGKLNERERLLVQRNASMLAPQPSQEIVPPTAPTAPMEVPSRSAAVERVPPIPVQTSTETTTSAGLAQALKKSQRARLTDAQPNATRIDPNMDFDTPPPGQGLTPSAQLQPEMPGSSRAGKRARADINDENEVPDPTQDEGFETDVRDFSAADQRRMEMQMKQAIRPQQRQQSSGAPGPSNYRSSAVPEESPAKRQRKNPGSSMPIPLPPLGPEDDGSIERYERSKINARLNSVQGPPRKMLQERVAWSRDEEICLLELVESHGGDGISWQYLKTIDETNNDVLWRRKAEDIRFKARNMLVTLLRDCKTVPGLPLNWEKVQLGKKEIAILHRHGIEYEQERLRAVPVSHDE